MKYSCGEGVEVEKQEEFAMCWAAIVVAIARYHKISMPNQGGLKSRYTSGQNRPEKVLTDYGFSATELANYRIASSGDGMIERRVDVHHNLVQRISNGPVLASLATADDVTWQLVNGTSYNWHHAILIRSYDDGKTSGEAKVTYVDPACQRGNNERSVGLKELIEGFDYTSLGPQARARLVNSPGMVRARLRKLIALDPPGV